MINVSQRKTVSVFFRCDAGIPLGTGHVQRCLTLAQALAGYGVDCHFVTRNDSSLLAAQLITPCFPCHFLDTALSQEQEIHYLIEMIVQSLPAVVIIDSYQINEDYLRELRRSGIPIVVIDDFASIAVYDCDMIINQNVYAESITYRTSFDTVIFRGPRFALLRSEFLLNRQKLHRFHPRLAKKLLVTMGGTDPAGATSKVLQAIHQLSADLEKQLKVTVAVGTGCQSADEIASKVARLSDGHLVIQSNQMATIMSDTDLSINAGGTTAYELAALGVPSMVFSIADNQKAVGNALHQKEMAVYIGNIEQASVEAIRVAIERLILDQQRRSRLSRQASQLVDGRGAGRVARYILEELISK